MLMNQILVTYHLLFAVNQFYKDGKATSDEQNARLKKTDHRCLIGFVVLALPCLSPFFGDAFIVFQQWYAIFISIGIGATQVLISCVLFRKMEANNILKEVMKGEVKTLKRVLLIFSVSYTASLIVAIWYTSQSLISSDEKAWESTICGSEVLTYTAISNLGTFASEQLPLFILFRYHYKCFDAQL
jgi:hypothetical protein